MCKTTTFCQDNPTSPMCATKAYTAATCGAAPSCSGDAIECAIAQSAFETKCALQGSSTSEAALYDSSKVLTGSQTGSLPGNETVNITSGSFSQSNVLGGSGGVADLVVSVQGRSLTLPFSNLNQYLAYLGNILMAVAFLLALRIVSRG